jgi:outer membrane protein OmpA-like peptidoglycan-associated protein/tetratricopeptide (TPR) repeat protein
MKKIFTLTILLCCIILHHAEAQQSKKELALANSLFDKLAYTDAIVAFKGALVQDSAQFEVMAKLADSYRLTGNYGEAEKWYAKVVNDGRATDLHRFHYGQMLMNNGKHQVAQRWLNIVADERPSDERVQNYLKSMDDINRFFVDSINYVLESFPSNGNGNDFSPFFYDDGVVFTSSRKVTRKTERHAWTGESYTDLYYCDPANRIEEFAQAIRSPLNNGPASFAGNEMFTTTNVAKVRNNQKDLYKLNIVSSTFDGKRWKKPSSFVHNSPDYNFAHPAISNDGQRLFFSSDMPGGEGGMDLYYCDRAGDGWGKPVSLGKLVNTPGHEVFPFIHSDGALYFASNGHEGLGALDIYSTSFSNNEWLLPTALSFPVNTPYDDFGFILDHDRSRGYFSSNRPGGKGGDDIYSFIFTPTVLEGLVVNKQINQVLKGASVLVTDKVTGKQVPLTSDSAGRFIMNVTACREYEIRSTHTAYADAVITMTKTSCITGGKQSTEVVFSNPILTVKVLHKFTNDPLDAVIEIRNTETGTVVATGKADETKPFVVPCTEYELIARNTGMPDVKTYFKTACIAANEIVTLKMGNPPADPSFAGGAAVDQDSRTALDSVVVVVYDNANKAVLTLTTAADGTFAVAGIKNISRMVFFRNGYFSVTKVLADESDRKNVVAELPKLKLDKIIQLEGIYYDVGKSSIRPDAARVLDNLVKVLEENPSLEIELSAHTDSRGKDDSNLQLSDKRAKSAAAYITNKGIAPGRIVGKGYGEMRLKNNCGNSARCAEKQHQENRRTEVKITGY